MEFEIGQIFDREYPPEAAAWCNNNEAYIEARPEGGYIIVKTPPPAEPTAEEKVRRLEEEYGLPRPVRTTLLALREQGAELDGQLMARVDEIEALAAPLRGADA